VAFQHIVLMDRHQGKVLRSKSCCFGWLPTRRDFPCPNSLAQPAPRPPAQRLLQPRLLLQLGLLLLPTRLVALRGRVQPQLLLRAVLRRLGELFPLPPWPRPWPWPRPASERLPLELPRSPLLSLQRRRHRPGLRVWSPMRPTHTGKDGGGFHRSVELQHPSRLQTRPRALRGAVPSDRYRCHRCCCCC